MSVNVQREMNRRILERIASDAQFREELLDDPRTAMERAGFSWESSDGDDVAGYGLFQTTAITCPVAGGGGPVTSTAITCPDPGAGGGGGGPIGSTAITCAEPKPTTSGSGGTGWTDPPPPVNS